jgi:hypothetical protein
MASDFRTLRQVRAGMRLAGDEQHAQMLAHDVDLGDRNVVLQRQLAFRGFHLQLDDGAARMGERQVDGQVLAHRHTVAGHLRAVYPQTHGDRRTVGKLGIDNAEIQALQLVQDGETRSPVQHDAAIPLALLAGDQGMDRCGEAEGSGVRRHVGNNAVGDQDGAGHLLGRHVVDQLGEGGEQGRAVAVRLLDGAHLAHFEAAQGRQSLLHGGGCLLGLRGAVAEPLAGAFVHNEGDDPRQALAFLALQHRVGERQNQQGGGDQAQHRAAHALPGEHQHDKKQQAAKPGDDFPGQDGVEGKRQTGHWPSLSSRAGTCTWSAL